MNKTFTKSLVIAFLLLSILLQACQPAASPSPTAEQVSEPPSTEAVETVKIKMLILPYLAYAPFFIAQDEGYFAEQGLEVEFVRMEVTADAMPLLAKGEIDIASGLVDVSTLNAIAKGSNIKYVSDKGYLDGNSDCSYTGWVVRKELVESGTLDDLNNMAGLKIASNRASASEYYLDLLLSEVGLSSDDLEYVDVPVPARPDSLASGAIDLAGVAEPWIIRTVKTGKGLLWQPWEKLSPGSAFSVIMYGPSILDEKSGVGKRFMVAYLKGVAQYNEGKTDRNVEIIAKHTQLDPGEVKGACWQSIKADGMIDTQSVISFQEWANKRGYMDQIVPVEQFWDPSFAEYAYGMLK